VRTREEWRHEHATPDTPPAVNGGGAEATHCPAFPVTAVDTTAAGDAFNGALAVGLAAGGSLDQAIPLASAAAALTRTRRGAQDSLPDRAAVEGFRRSLREVSGGGARGAP
jgi:ribokinase